MSISLPLINASLNAITMLFLIKGRFAAAKGDQKNHQFWMIASLIMSALFLSCYAYYHVTSSIVNVYHRQGLLRWIYYTILFTHIPLAAMVIPMCTIAIQQVIKGNITRHRRITQWLWPIWMYVSITGVLIYLMLYVF